MCCTEASFFSSQPRIALNAGKAKTSRIPITITLRMSTLGLESELFRELYEAMHHPPARRLSRWVEV
jgi:hypothetical protein